MKVFLIALSFIFMTVYLFAMDPPYYIYDMNNNLNKMSLINTIQDIYSYFPVSVTSSTYATSAGEDTTKQNKIFTLLTDKPTTDNCPDQNIVLYYDLTDYWLYTNKADVLYRMAWALVPANAADNVYYGSEKVYYGFDEVYYREP
jgi:hypothetical protein